MQTPNHRHRILTTRHYTTACRCDRFRSALETALDEEPGNLGELWTWSEDDAGSSFRIFGLGLQADVVVEVVPGRKRTSRSEVTIHCREGDLPLLERLEAALGDALLRPAETPAAADEPFRLFDSAAQVLQAFQQTRVAGITVTDSAVDSALECLHGETDAVLAAIKRLPALRRAVETRRLPDDVSPDALERYLRVWPKARLCLHGDDKVRLTHRLLVPDEHGILILKVHFAYLPASREHVIGWVEESIGGPFGERD